jgi:predicted RNA-binding protein YlxR (DUF448 family)
VSIGSSTTTGGPVRTCIGCGGKATQRELVCLRLVDGAIVVGGRGRGGRGAWLHPADACLERAARRRAFGRAFRVADVHVEPRFLRELLTGSPRKD